MVVKEWHCKHCDYGFDSFVDLCPRCARSASRAFRTAPGYITRGLVAKVDKVLGAELADRGLSDLPKPRDYRESEPVNPYMPGMWDKCSGSGQAPITPGWGRSALQKTNESFGTNFTPPISDSGPSYSTGAENAVGPSRDYVRKHTQIVARIDKNGDRIG